MTRASAQGPQGLPTHWPPSSWHRNPAAAAPQSPPLTHRLRGRPGEGGRVRGCRTEVPATCRPPAACRDGAPEASAHAGLSPSPVCFPLHWARRSFAQPRAVPEFSQTKELAVLPLHKLCRHPSNADSEVWDGARSKAQLPALRGTCVYLGASHSFLRRELWDTLLGFGFGGALRKLPSVVRG